MNKKLSVLTINVCAAILGISSISLILPDAAQAQSSHSSESSNVTSDLLDITTSGIWTSVEVENDNQNAVSGLGTKKIRWGNPTENNKKSSYVFEGKDTSIGLDGGNYLLGTFTHNNFPITGDTITGANLALSLDFGDSSHTFDLAFKHDETPNYGYKDVDGTRSSVNPRDVWDYGKYWDYGWYKKHTWYGWYWAHGWHKDYGWHYEKTEYHCGISGWQTKKCEDFVSIPTLMSKEHIDIDGEKYQLVISGFFQNDELTNRFITQENKSNSAQIFGRLRRVPEPAAGLGLLAISAIGTFKLKRKTRVA